jgi:hypothetical protein
MVSERLGAMPQEPPELRHQLPCNLPTSRAAYKWSAESQVVRRTPHEKVNQTLQLGERAQTWESRRLDELHSSRVAFVQTTASLQIRQTTHSG